LNYSDSKYYREISVRSNTENLLKIRNFVRDGALALGFTEEVVGNITLAVDEASTNIIKHAYKYSPEGEIIIQTDFADKKYIIKIIDAGNHFDPTSVPVPDLKEYHKQKKVGGLGMFLMKKLMDEVVYDNPDERMNQVTLVKYLT